MPDPRVEAVESYVYSLRSGEPSAAERAAPHLAADVVLSDGRNEFSGKAAVLARITGFWPNTPVYHQGGWSDPVEENGRIVVTAVFPPLGAAPKSLTLTFAFDAASQIRRVDQAITPQSPPAETTTIPDFVRGVVNSALANGTPIVLAYTDADGAPSLSLRGSVQVYSDSQLCIWARSAEGGLARALAGPNNQVSLLYRESKTRSTLIFRGRARIATDETTRSRVYEMVPEVEQNHDPDRRGAAVLIDVERIQGGTVYGPVRMVRSYA
jgi:hypothetical protein